MIKRLVCLANKKCGRMMPCEILLSDDGPLPTMCVIDSRVVVYEDVTEEERHG